MLESANLFLEINLINRWIWVVVNFTDLRDKL